MQFGIVTLPNAGIEPVLAGRAGCLASVTDLGGKTEHLGPASFKRKAAADCCSRFALTICPKGGPQARSTWGTPLSCRCRPVVERQRFVSLGSSKLFIKGAINLVVLIGAQGVHNQLPFIGRQSFFRLMKRGRRWVLTRIHLLPFDKQTGTFSINCVKGVYSGSRGPLCQLLDTSLSCHSDRSDRL